MHLLCKRKALFITIIALLCITVVLGFLMADIACAATTEESSEWHYTVDSDGYAVLTRYLGENTDVTVPASLNGYEVKTIGSLTFSRRDDITSISIPSTVTTLEEWAVYDLNGLQVLTIGGELESVSNTFATSANLGDGGAMIYTIPSNEAVLLEAGVSSGNLDTADIARVTVSLVSDGAAETDNTEDTNDTNDSSASSGSGEASGGSSSKYSADNGASIATYSTYVVPSVSVSNGSWSYTLNPKVQTAANVSIASITGQDIPENTSEYTWSIVTSEDEDITVTLVGVSDAVYSAAEEEKDYADGFSPDETNISYDKTFKILTESEAEELNASLASSSGYANVYMRITYEAGIYVNGVKFEVSDDLRVYDASTGVLLYGNDGEAEGLYTSLSELPDANGSTSNYKYIGYLMNEAGDAISVIYYSPYSLDSTSYTTTVTGVINPGTGSDALINGMNGKAYPDEVYGSFVNGVVEADGITIDLSDWTDSESYGSMEEGILTIYSSETGTDGNQILAASNLNRSLLWASNGGVIHTGAVNLYSSSTTANTLMSRESNLSSYNEEIGMEWGMGAVAYATGGGHIILGDPDGDIDTGYLVSYVESEGETSNGAIAVTTGEAGEDGYSGTSIVEVYNTVMNLQGWNNHIADVMYGGYIYLENVIGYNGIKGSYAVGQSGTITNDFGNGVIEGTNVTDEAYGNRTAGTYVIGDGIISLSSSNLKCYTDGGAVIASGGTFHLTNTIAEGVMALKFRGGISTDTSHTSTFDNCTFIAVLEYEEGGYVYGDDAAAARDAWIDATGENQLYSWVFSEIGYTMGDLCDLYELDSTARAELYAALEAIRADGYSDSTLVRCSVLDNTLFNYNANAYSTDTDFTDVPYLTFGCYGGLLSAVIEAEAAGSYTVFTNCTFENVNSSDYNYLIASETGSAPQITFEDTEETITGIIWNEGDVTRASEGRSSARTSSLHVTFINSNFEGSFADGSNGLWNGSTGYYNNNGEYTYLNGNYYGAEANWGTTAYFDADSSWTVTYDSYIGSLTMEEGADIHTAYGLEITSITVDGEAVASLDDLVTGEEMTNVIITVSRSVFVGYGAHGSASVDGDSETAVITAVPDEGYIVDSVTVTTEDGTAVEVGVNADGTYAFSVPDEPVTVLVTFVPDA